VVRYRKSLIQARATEANRIQKVLEGSNIKLARVISDVLRVSGVGIREIRPIHHVRLPQGPGFRRLPAPIPLGRGGAQAPAGNAGPVPMPIQGRAA
jgi:hypothetical protein